MTNKEYLVKQIGKEEFDKLSLEQICWKYIDCNNRQERKEKDICQICVNNWLKEIKV